MHRQVCFYKCGSYELKKAADAFWYMEKDLDYDEFPDLKDMFNEEWFKGGFPDSTKRITEMLNNREQLSELTEITAALVERNKNEGYNAFSYVSTGVCINSFPIYSSVKHILRKGLPIRLLTDLSQRTLSTNTLLTRVFTESMIRRSFQRAYRPQGTG